MEEAMHNNNKVKHFDKQSIDNIPPINHLPKNMQYMVEAIRECSGNIPIAIPFNSIMATVTLAAQKNIRVTLPNQPKEKPVSELYLTIAASGERKSTSDSMVLKAIKDYEDKIHTEYENNKNKLDQTKQRGKDSDVEYKPAILINDPTIDGIINQLKTSKSLGIFTTEGGEFLFGTNMRKENKNRTASILSRTWDGEKITYARVMRGSDHITGLISMHIMIQPRLADPLINDILLEDQGLLSRILPVMPVSKIGTRIIEDINFLDLHKNTINSFNNRIKEMLESKEETKIYKLSKEARSRYIDYCNQHEKRLGDTGDLCEMRSIFNKFPEHACRIAAILAYFEQQEDISLCILNSAIAIMRFYEQEWMKITAKDSACEDAKLLLQWLRNKWDKKYISVTDISQRGPKIFRGNASKIVSSLKYLITEGYLSPPATEQQFNSKRNVYEINLNESETSSH